MKKIIITLAAIMTLSLCAFAGEENVRPEVLKAFQSKFETAQDVEWKAGSNYYKANFTYNGYRLVAFYNSDAELLGITRYIVSAQLPLYLQNKIKSKYQNYWITDLFELSNAAGFIYYITLENADQKIILKSEYGSDWQVFQKEHL